MNQNSHDIVSCDIPIMVINFINFVLLTFLFCSSKCVSGSVDLEEYGTLDLDILQGINPKSTCGKQYAKLGNTWFKMLDAGNRILPGGIMYGNYFDLGNYEECLNITKEVDAMTIYGKYCLATIPKNVMKPQSLSLTKEFQEAGKHSDFKLRMLGGDMSTMGIQLAYCVPSGCKAEDLNYREKLVFRDQFCRTNEDKRKLTAGAICTIVFLSLVLLVAVIQTGYDAYLHHTQQKPCGDIFIAFSFLTNGRKLLSTNRNPDQLPCLNGLKAISMMWVILGHTFTSGGFIKNFNDIWEWKDKTASYFLLGATVSVDTFFAVGGLVIVYTYMKAMDKGVSFSLWQYYLHRYLRLTPALAIVVLFYVTLVEYTGDGPLWSTVETELRDVCKKMWWSTLLYIQNYVSDDGQFCIGQSWYLSVDMQLFLLTPVILLPLRRWPLYTLGGLGFLILCGIAAPFYVAWQNNVMASIITQDAMTSYYTATDARFGPYVIGMLTGYFIYQIKKTKYQLRMRNLYVVGIWITVLVGMGACVFAQEPMFKDKNRLSNSFHIAFNRNAWAAGVCILTVLCTLRKGGPIDAFLSASIFQLITKLSYSMYITHLGIIRVWVATSTTEHTFSNSQRIFEYWGYVVFTLVASVPLCLLFESPIITIEKLIFGGHKKPAEVKNPDV